MTSTWMQDALEVQACDSDREVGEAVAEDLARNVANRLMTRDSAAVVLAPSPGTHPVIEAIRARSDIEWSRVDVLLVDAYIGLSNGAPQSTAWRLRSVLLDDVAPASFQPLDGTVVPIESEVHRYSRLLEDLQPVAAVLGIGANGHLAFNEPPAEFDPVDLVTTSDVAPETVQQIRDARLYPSSELIPTRAITVSLKGLASVGNLIVFATGPETRTAVDRLLTGPIEPGLPASILRRNRNARLYLGPAVIDSRR